MTTNLDETHYAFPRDQFTVHAMAGIFLFNFGRKNLIFRKNPFEQKIQKQSKK